MTLPLTRWSYEHPPPPHVTFSCGSGGLGSSLLPTKLSPQPLSYFLTESFAVACPGLKLMALQPRPPECWN